MKVKMSDSKECKWWIEFFTNAGISSKLAAKYALIFINHHMQKNMLLDLNYDILNMMGIKAVGDNIAILKHAKSVHDERDLESVLPTHRVTINSTCNEPGDDHEEEEEEERGHETEFDNVSNVKKPPSVVTRMFDHYTRNSPSSTVSKPNKIMEKSMTKLDPSIDRATGKIMRVVAPLKRKIPTLRSDEMEEEAESTRSPPTSVVRISNSSSSLSPDSPNKFKKIRRVLPEHEGGYTIKMPVGSTPRSKEILEKYKELKSKSKTVFDRLGDCNVSSTTQPENNVRVIFDDSSILEQKAVSVFDRLGNRPLKREIEEEYEPLKYNGILKNAPTKKTTISISNCPTMRADEPRIPATLRAVPFKAVNAKTVHTTTERILSCPTMRADEPKVPATLRTNSSKTTHIKPILVKKIFNTDSNEDSSRTSVMLKTSVKNRLGSSSSKSDKKISPNSSKEELLEGGNPNIRSQPIFKKVTFGETEHRYISRQIPKNCGSIILQTGVFKPKG